MHLDLYKKKQEEEVNRLLQLGARRHPWRYRPGSDFVVLEDPDGNLSAWYNCLSSTNIFRVVNEICCNNHQVHSWVYSHVKLVFIFVGYSEPVPLVEMTRGINLNNRQRNSF
jgi:hypothetical protein